VHRELEQLEPQRLAAPRLVERPLEDRRCLLARLAEHDALELGREGVPVVGEEPPLRPGPALLGVEQQPVAVEHDGVRRLRAAHVSHRG